MPVTPEQLTILRAHLDGRLRTCPVCQTPGGGWEASFIGVLPPPQGIPLTAYNSETARLAAALRRSGLEQSEEMPLAMVTCQVCFYVMPFAWRPIEERAQRQALEEYLRKKAVEPGGAP